MDRLRLASAVILSVRTLRAFGFNDRRTGFKECVDLIFGDCGQSHPQLGAGRLGEPFQFGAAGVCAERHELLPFAEYLNLAELASLYDFRRLTIRCPIEHEAAQQSAPCPDRGFAECRNGQRAATSNDSGIIDIEVQRPQSRDAGSHPLDGGRASAGWRTSIIRHCLVWIPPHDDLPMAESGIEARCGTECAALSVGDGAATQFDAAPGAAGVSLDQRSRSTSVWPGFRVADPVFGG
jgi:hypothetical protein